MAAFSFAGFAGDADVVFYGVVSDDGDGVVDVGGRGCGFFVAGGDELLLLFET